MELIDLPQSLLSLFGSGIRRFTDFLGTSYRKTTQAAGNAVSYAKSLARSALALPPKIGKAIGQTIVSPFTGIAQGATELAAQQAETAKKVSEAVENLKPTAESALSFLQNLIAMPFKGIGAGVGTGVESIGTGLGSGLGQIGQGAGVGISGIGTGAGVGLAGVGTGAGVGISGIGRGTGIGTANVLAGVGTGAGVGVQQLGAGLGGGISNVGAGVGAGAQNLGAGLGGGIGELLLPIAAVAIIYLLISSKR